MMLCYFILHAIALSLEPRASVDLLILANVYLFYVFLKYALLLCGHSGLTSIVYLCIYHDMLLNNIMI